MEECIMNKRFDFQPAPWLPFRDKEVLEKVRFLTREEMENFKHENPEFKTKIVYDVQSHFVADLYNRIRMSDKNNQKLTIILPTPYAAAYINVAEVCNRYNVSCRNLNVFFMYEYADQDNNVAPLTYYASMGRSFKKYFYDRLNVDLRPPEDQINYFTTENVSKYSDMIEERGDGGADVMYSSVGWSGRIASIEPTGDFKADTIEDYVKLGSRVVTPLPESISEDSLMGMFGCAGDVANVPPKAATIGPRDVANARYHVELQYRGPLGMTTSWQRQISRLMLYGPVTMAVPASILRLYKGICYVSEDIAKPIELPPDKNPLE
jgi:glucosamine-6-phosphate deaminase